MKKLCVLLLALLLSAPGGQAAALVSADALAKIPLLLQKEYDEVVVTAQGAHKSVRTSGCGAACLSMAAGYLSPNIAQDPNAVFRWAAEHELYNGNGLQPDAMSALASWLNMDYRWVDGRAEEGLEAVRAALREGFPVIGRMGSGTFTRGGHYILLRGFDQEGKVLVNDPASEERTQKSYDLNLIARQTRPEQSFLILRTTVIYPGAGRVEEAVESRGGRQDTEDPEPTPDAMPDTATGQSPRETATGDAAREEPKRETAASSRDNLVMMERPLVIAPGNPLQHEVDAGA